MHKPTRLLLVVLFDMLSAIAAWVGGFLIRFNLSWPSGFEAPMITGGIVLIAVHALACRWAGLYKGMWIFASLPDLKRVLKAVAVSTFGLFAFVALTPPAEPATPRSLLILYPLLLLVIMGGGRAAWRMWKEHRLYGGLIASGKPVIVVGAGTGGAMLVRELERSPDWRVVALVDDDQRKWGLEIFGQPVVGPVDLLPQVLHDQKAQHVILAMPSAARDTLKRAAEISVQAGAHVFTVPGLEDLMTGKVAINTMRPVDIEDLLGREPISIDTANVQEMILGKNILITGAGGSIGSELCRQLGRFEPARLVLIEANELALYNIEQWFREFRPDLNITPYICDVKDAERVLEIFNENRPELVFHAAAYKHVPLMEQLNAWQAVTNNVLGTLRVAEAACQFGVKRFVLISTDKAVNPTNIMGATKRVAEMVCESVGRRSSSTTQFEIVRFGNVLGSTGSVIPKFATQIARGGPVTVTHPDINRYFMSIPEAAQLVLQATAMGNGGEIFVFDMGAPVKIVDLARNMIRLSGYTEEDIRIEFTGLRPGEKLFEELLADLEVTRETAHPKLRIARTRAVPEGFIQELSAWLDTVGPVSDDTVRTRLKHWLPEYTPSAPGQND